MNKKQVFAYTSVLLFANITVSSLLLFFVVPFLFGEATILFYSTTIPVFIMSTATLVILWTAIHFFLRKKYETRVQETILILLLSFGILILIIEILFWNLNITLIDLSRLVTNSVILNALVTVGIFLLTIFYPLWKIASLPKGIIPSKTLRIISILLLVTIFAVLPFQSKRIVTSRRIQQERVTVRESFIKKILGGEDVYENCRAVDSRLPCNYLTAVLEHNSSLCKNVANNDFIIEECEAISSLSIDKLKKFGCFHSGCWFVLAVVLQDQSYCQKTGIGNPIVHCSEFIIADE